MVGELVDRSRRHADAEFVVLDLFRNAQQHRCLPSQRRNNNLTPFEFSAGVARITQR
jgi:hypothetical protein